MFHEEVMSESHASFLNDMPTVQEVRLTYSPPRLQTVALRDGVPCSLSNWLRVRCTPLMPELLV